MLLWQLKKFLESRKSNEIKFQFRTAVFRFAQNVFLNFYEGRTQSLNLSGLPASFHYAVFLKGGLTQTLYYSGLPFFALLKTSSLTSTRGVPKASTIPRCGIAGRFYLFAFSSELESP
jgi:hypothetical protein